MDKDKLIADLERKLATALDEVRALRERKLEAEREACRLLAEMRKAK